MKARFAMGLAALALVGVGAARADDYALKKELQGQYGKLAGAILRKDFQAVRQMVTPDASWKLLDGKKRDLKQMEGVYRRRVAALKPGIQFTVSISRMTPQGKEEQVECTHVFAGFKTDGKGKTHHLFEGSAWRDLWTKTAHGWKLKRSEQVNQRQSVDGKPVTTPVLPST
ncbi:MAG TPA: hypothetical protein VFB38_06475 [Chthonomonadaceae bacterium]|nr:hypothetical protein [Chthonomonadaceae bacterium]